VERVLLGERIAAHPEARHRGHRRRILQALVAQRHAAGLSSGLDHCGAASRLRRNPSRA
jgi:hypothetical protein